MKKVRVHVIERFTERTLALSNPLDEAAANKFVDDFNELFYKSPIKDVDILIEEDDEDDE